MRQAAAKGKPSIEKTDTGRQRNRVLRRNVRAGIAFIHSAGGAARLAGGKNSILLVAEFRFQIMVPASADEVFSGIVLAADLEPAHPGIVEIVEPVKALRVIEADDVVLDVVVEIGGLEPERVVGKEEIVAKDIQLEFPVPGMFGLEDIERTQSGGRVPGRRFPQARPAQRLGISGIELDALPRLHSRAEDGGEAGTVLGERVFIDQDILGADERARSAGPLILPSRTVEGDDRAIFIEVADDLRFEIALVVVAGLEVGITQAAVQGEPVIGLPFGAAEAVDLLTRPAAAGPLKALRDQAAANAECTQLALDSSGNQDVSPDMLKGFARKASERIRLDGGGYRRDHLRALAQRVEVADDEVRIMGSKSELLRTLVAASSGKSAAFGVQSSVLKWRARKDSNL